jgi:uncharacterized membrane protein/Mg-chelatase subunit ChlD
MALMRELLADLPVTFGRPWWLLAIPLLIPPLVWMSRRSLAGMGTFRRWLAILLRVAVITLVVLALAETRAVKRRDALTTLFLIDTSESMPIEWRARVFDFINQSARRKRNSNDLVGVIAFGREARVEIPPVPEPPPIARIESRVEGDQTDLADAVKLALATFPEDTARRIVVFSDGNENRGRAMDQALAAAGLKVQIDVVPIEYRYDDEVLIEKISAPADVKQGDTVELNVVLRANAPTKGRLQIWQKTNTYRVPISEEPVPIDLERGVNVRTLKQTITEPNFYTFTAEFIPDPGSGDRRRINNSADGFIYARGTAHVLLIESAPGEHDELAQALRSRQMQVTSLVAPGIGPGGVEAGDALPTDLAQLQQYDAVILGNVPKDAFTDSQIQMLETNTRDLGAGLIMLGGPNSFGAGKWNRTPVEQALPVDMDIKDQKITGKSALVMVMHASEIPEGNFWQKKIAQEAIKTLSPYDMAGLIHWQGQEAWLFTLQNIGERQARMLRAIDGMTPGDMPDVDPSLLMGAQALARTDAMTKHYIVISDGDPTAPTPNLINLLIRNRITVTTVLVAAHGGDVLGPSWMQSLAQQTKGRFYNVPNPQALPRIYQKEVRLISRPLLFERQEPWKLQVNPSNAGSELIAGLSEESLPPITGLVLTSRKENPLVEIPLVSPLPAGQFNPVLAHWTYGLGRAVAFTSDAGRKWTTAWPTWENYSAFWWQVVRWALRPVDDRNLTLSLRREEGEVKVVVDALDKDDRFVNFLQFQGGAVSPELNADGTPKKQTIAMVQTAPGRYEGTIDNAEAQGNYFVSLGYVGPDGKTGLISGGVSVPYSEEYRELRSNSLALEALAETTGGQVHRWVTRSDSGDVDIARSTAGVDVFRRDPSITPPSGMQPLWHLLLFWGSMLFLADVAARRLAPDLGRLRRSLADAWQRLRGQAVAPAEEYMEKLRSRKAEVREQLSRTRMATRFEAPPPAERGDVPREVRSGVEEAARRVAAAAERPASKADRPKPKPAAPEKWTPAAPAGESYADRLLRAKKKLWEKGDGKNEPDPTQEN